MRYINHIYFRQYTLSAGIFLVFSSLSYAQAPPQPTQTPPPPATVTSTPPQVTYEYDDSDDNDEYTRRASSVGCCFRRDEWFGIFCSLQNLDTTIKAGDLVQRINQGNGLFCAEETGGVTNMAAADNSIISVQDLASPFHPSNLFTSPLELIFNFLTGTGGQLR